MVNGLRAKINVRTFSNFPTFIDNLFLNMKLEKKYYRCPKFEIRVERKRNCELGEVSFRMLKLGELGEVSLRKLKLGELSKVSLRKLKLGEVSFGSNLLGEYCS